MELSPQKDIGKFVKQNGLTLAEAKACVALLERNAMYDANRQARAELDAISDAPTREPHNMPAHKKADRTGRNAGYARGNRVGFGHDSGKGQERNKSRVDKMLRRELAMRDIEPSARELAEERDFLKKTGLTMDEARDLNERTLQQDQLKEKLLKELTYPECIKVVNDFFGDKILTTEQIKKFNSPEFISRMHNWEEVSKVMD